MQSESTFSLTGKQLQMLKLSATLLAAAASFSANAQQTPAAASPTQQVIPEAGGARAAAVPSPTASTTPLIADGITQTHRHFVTGDGVRIAYRIDGPADKPALVLSNSIATTMHMWDAQVPALSRHFRVIRYDTRGHGASDAPAGAYSFDRLGRDVVELLDALKIRKAHFLGLSLGGLIGQWLGIHTPERIDRLILSNTSAYLGPAEQWDQRIAALLEAKDMSSTADMFISNWFPKKMLDANDARVQPFRAMVLATDRQGLAGAFAAVRDADMRRTVALIERPTLVIAGRDDTVTLASHSELIAAAVPNSKLVVLPTVHLPNVEQPGEFLDVVFDFLR